MEILFGIVDFFALKFPTKILIAELLFCRKLERRSHFWWRFVPAAAFFLAWPYIQNEFSVMLGGWFALYFFLYYIYSIFLVLLCFKIDWKTWLFYCSSAYALEHCSSALHLAAIDLYVSKNPRMFFSWQVMLIRLFVNLATYIVLYFIFVRRVTRTDTSIIKFSYIGVMSFVIVLLVNILSVWMLHRGRDMYHNLYDGICCMLILFAQYSIVVISESVQKNSRMEAILYQREVQNRRVEEDIKFINIKYHDLKHWMSQLGSGGLRAMSDGDLKKLGDSMSVYNCYFKTGNPSLDVVLTHFKMMCERAGVQLTCMIGGNISDYLDEDDVYALFGNALDNALESVSAEGDEQKKLIFLTISEKTGLLSIHLENYCGQKLEFADGLPVTTKGDRAFHGYGMRSIRYIVEKYDGHMTVSQNDGMFCLDILFSCRKH